MVRWLLNFAYRYPRLILVVLVSLTIAAAPALSGLKFDISAQSLLAKSDPSWQVYQKSLEQFGSDSVVMLILSDKNLFDANKLKAIKQVLKRLEKLEFVSNSSSLFNVPNVKEVDGYVESKPFLLDFPENPEQTKQLIDDALANTLVHKNLISSDHQTMGINVFIKGSQDKPGRDTEITKAIEAELKPLKSVIDTVFQMSAPYVRDQISKQIQVDMNSMLPAALVVLIVVLGLSMGRLNCAVVPLSSATISIVLTLSFMAWMEIPVNVLTSIIPALLIIIGSTEDVHLMAEYHSGIREGLSRDEAVQRLPINQSLAIFLAFVTTIAGFLSITVSDLELLQQFGWLVSGGLMINFLVTTLFVPAYLRLFGGSMSHINIDKNIFQILASGIFSIVMRIKKTILLLLMLVAGYYAWGAQFLEINNDTLAYFNKQSEVRQRAEKIHKDLSGMQTFSIILDSGIEGTFKKVRYLEEIEKVQQFIGQQGVFDKSFSFADFIKLTHKVMEGVSKPQLPLEDEVVQVYMEFVQFEAVSSYVNPDFSSARILVRHNQGNSLVLKKAFHEIENYIKYDLKSHMRVTLTGDSVLNNKAADAMAWGQIQSLVLMVLVILLLVSILFIDIRAGFIALIPNVFPVVVLFGVMGYYHIPLDSGTTMVAVIALGICVDDTIHFLSRYHFFTRGTDNVEKALRKTILHEATPIGTTSIALALGFSTLMLSSFQPVVYFGALSALVMVLAMFSTFILTPILLSFIRLISVWDMLSLNLKDDVLKNSPIFKGLKSFQIKRAILSGSIREYSNGDVIVEQGVQGETFFVLLEGSAKATHRDSDGSIHTLSYLKAGDLFGEIAELSKRERMSRVTAQERVRALEMKWSGIRQLGLFHPRISMRLYRNLSEVMSHRIVEMTSHKDKSRDELTGALTKSYLCEFMQQELKRSHYQSEALSLILLDIDIKAIEVPLTNQLHDNVILSISHIINTHLKGTDILARWDECCFMLVLPGSDGDAALNLVGAIQKDIQSDEMGQGIQFDLTASVTQVKAGERSKQVLDRLEHQLQSLKQNPKNVRVSFA
jgi:uncharacterized protein